MNMRILTVAAALASLAGWPGPAQADVFDVPWWTIDGGGMLYSTGGAFELSGTIGQADAGALTGGPFELTGGFWRGTRASTLGDLNCDGVVNFDDINPFVLALSDPPAYQAQYPDCNIMNGDCNSDGVIDFADINAFIDILSGGV